MTRPSSILAYYPLHNQKQAQSLSACWLPWRVAPWDQPIDLIRDYFGEKIGMYFEFLGHYTTWLLPLSLGGESSRNDRIRVITCLMPLQTAGIVVGIDIIVETAIYGTYTKAIGQGYTIPIFCVFVAFWSQLMLEYWKRTEATKAMEWGKSCALLKIESAQHHDALLCVGRYV